VITQQRLLELFDYDPLTGLFTSLGGRRGAVKGRIIGRIDKRANGRVYIRITVDGKHYYAHRLAHLYMAGEVPDEIDHWDRDGTNNRWKNIRECTRAENSANKPASILSQTGYRGVTPLGDKFRAKIGVNGKQIHLGVFDTAEAAAEAYFKASCKYYGEFAYDWS
jgi:hypothetical protein